MVVVLYYDGRRVRRGAVRRRASPLFSSGDVRRRNHFIGDALLNVITLFNQGNGDIADGQVHCLPTKMLSSQALRILTDDLVA